MSDKCSMRSVTHLAAGNLKDLRQKIAYREERISHIREEISVKYDQIHVMKCEITEFKEMLKKDVKK